MRTPSRTPLSTRTSRGRSVRTRRCSPRSRRSSWRSRSRSARASSSRRATARRGSSRSTRRRSSAPGSAPPRSTRSSARRSSTAPARSCSATGRRQPGSAARPSASPAPARRRARTGATATSPTSRFSRSVLSSTLAHAGWDDAPDHVELSAPYAHQALHWARALGAGDGPAAFESGALSPTGGWLAGRPGVVAGLSAAIACARTLREHGSGRALAHGTTGLLGQSHHLVALEAAS